MRTQTTQPGAVRRTRPVTPRAVPVRPVSIRGSRPVTPRTRAAKPRPRPDAMCRKGRCAKSLRSDRDRKQNRHDRVTPSRRLQPKPERWRQSLRYDRGLRQARPGRVTPSRRLDAEPEAKNPKELRHRTLEVGQMGGAGGDP